MEKLITIRPLDAGETEVIRQIACWYETEWGTPVEKTIQRLSNVPGKDVIFHLVLRMDDEVVAAGGLWNDVNIFGFHEKLKKFRPWVAAIYTQESYRNRGLGSLMLEHIEERAIALGLEKLYLYTYSANQLYEKYGWKPIDSVEYRGHETAVMEKLI
jgi:GNAT superfamily N-acetyltransferase